MRKSVTQEFEYGCGIACFAFLLNTSYKRAEDLLGPKQAKSNRFWVKDLTRALNDVGLNYQSRYINKKLRGHIYKEGTIVLIRRSKKYPAGHYLVRHSGHWMDPWINLSKSNDMSQAKSGFRKRLPGSPVYMLFGSAWITRHREGFLLHCSHERSQ